jgi:hypothetical protein
MAPQTSQPVAVPQPQLVYTSQIQEQQQPQSLIYTYSSQPLDPTASTYQDPVNGGILTALRGAYAPLDLVEGVARGDLRAREEALIWLEDRLNPPRPTLYSRGGRGATRSEFNPQLVELSTEEMEDAKEHMNNGSIDIILRNVCLNCQLLASKFKV